MSNAPQYTPEQPMQPGQPGHSVAEKSNRWPMILVIGGVVVCGGMMMLALGAIVVMSAISTLDSSASDEFQSIAATVEDDSLGSSQDHDSHDPEPVSVTVMPPASQEFRPIPRAVQESEPVSLDTADLQPAPLLTADVLDGTLEAGFTDLSGVGSNEEANKIPSGYRVALVKVARSVGSEFSPGDQVDISLLGPDGTELLLPGTLPRNVAVFAVEESDMSDDPEAEITISLLVTPMQNAWLMTFHEMGQIDLTWSEAK